MQRNKTHTHTHTVLVQDSDDDDAYDPREKQKRLRRERRRLVERLEDHDAIASPYATHHAHTSPARARPRALHQKEEAEQENQGHVRHKAASCRTPHTGKQRPLRAIQDYQSKSAHKAQKRRATEAAGASKKRKTRTHEEVGHEDGAPPRKRQRRARMCDRYTQTDAPPPLDAQEVAQQVTSRFHELFAALFREKLGGVECDNDAFGAFLRHKAQETTELQDAFLAKVKAVQSEIYEKMKTDVLGKWKADVEDSMQLLHRHAASIQQESGRGGEDRGRGGSATQQTRMLPRSNSEDIVRKVSSLLRSYNAT